MNAVEAYQNARQREGRILSDELVRQLPFSGERTGYAEEWRVRARSLNRLVRMLEDRPRAVLEVGCGNGWLSARLAKAGHTVTGLDIGAMELEQAERVFTDRPVRWVLGDPWANALEARSFDLIVFAASIQYFSDPHALMGRCAELLQEGGEVLIMDSPLYADTAAAERARSRSVAYYTTLGSPEMAAIYQHHTEHALMNAAGSAHVQVLPPRGKMASLLFGGSPFPVVRIRY